MATEEDLKSVEILAPTSSVNSPALGALYVNMLRFHNAWATRSGMGQMAQIDAALTARAGVADYGFQKLLGSYVFRTNFGRIQMVHVILSRVTSNSSQLQSQNTTSYLVAVYDVTADQWHQETLFAHTSATLSNDAAMISAIQQWPEAPASKRLSLTSATDEQVGFTEYQDSLVIVAPAMGAWIYSPCDFGGVDDPLQIDGWRGNDGVTPFASPRGESACCAPIVATIGVNSDASYLDNGGFPRASCVTVIGGAVVYGADRTVYFSESGKPGSIPADLTYILNVPLQNPITAIAQNNGYLYIFSNTETWICQTDPSAPAAGQLTQLSYDIGCIGPNAITRIESSLVWASMHDLHATSGGPYNVTSICDELRPLFDDKLGNPLSSYYQTVGKLGTANSLEAERMYWDWRSIDNVMLSYDYRLRTLYVSVPDGRFVLVRQTSGDQENWSVWTLESIAQELTAINPNNAAIGVNRYLNHAQVLCLEGRVWIAAGMDTFIPPDTWSDGTAAPSGSLVLCEQGRGGGLDRSSIAFEDQRKFAGEWLNRSTTNGDTSATQYVVVDRPRYEPRGTLYPVSGACESQSVVYPIRVLASKSLQRLRITLPLNANFVPVMASSEGVDFILPPERYHSGQAFEVTWDGGNLVIDWDPTRAPSGWQTWPKMNNPLTQECTLCWIPFVLGNHDQQPQNLGYAPGQLSATADMYFGADGVPASLHLWSEPMPSTLQKPEDYYARPVDWQVKSEQLNVNGMDQIETRGTYARMLTSGASDEQKIFPWVHGLYNVVATSDWKDWASQIVDFSTWPDYTSNINNIIIQEKKSSQSAGQYPGITSINQPMRARVLDGSQEMIVNAFNVGSYWSSELDQTTGNSLAGDESYDTQTTSLETKGEHVSFLVFGHIQNRAESLVINSIKAVYGLIAGPRRWGR